MTHKEEKECEVFRRQDDIDAMREFSKWLRDGGMASLREMQQLSNEWKQVRAVGLATVVKTVVGFILAAIGAGVLAMMAKAK